MHSFALLASSKALVLSEKEINENGPCFVRLKGRRAGFIGWLLTVLGIDVWTEFSVYEDHIEIQEGSVSGKLNDLYPLSSVSNLGTGVIKPFLYLIMAAAFALLALVFIVMSIAKLGGMGWIMVLIWLGMAVGSIIKYKMGRTMMAYVITDGGTIASIFVRRSLIEAKTLSEEEIDQIIGILTKLVREKH